MTAYTAEQITDILLQTETRLTAKIDLAEDILAALDKREISQAEAELQAIGFMKEKAHKLWNLCKQIKQHADDIGYDRPEMADEKRAYLTNTLTDYFKAEFDKDSKYAITNIDIEEALKKRKGYLMGRPCRIPPGMIASIIFDKPEDEDANKQQTKSRFFFVDGLVKRFKPSAQKPKSLRESLQILQDTGLNKQQIKEIQKILKQAVNTHLGSAIDRIFNANALKHTDLETASRVSTQAARQLIEQNPDANITADHLTDTIHGAIVNYASANKGVIITNTEPNDAYYLGQRLQGKEIDAETAKEIKHTFLQNLNRKMGFETVLSKTPNAENSASTQPG